MDSSAIFSIILCISGFVESKALLPELDLNLTEPHQSCIESIDNPLCDYSRHQIASTKLSNVCAKTLTKNDVERYNSEHEKEFVDKHFLQHYESPSTGFVYLHGVPGDELLSFKSSKEYQNHAAPILVELNYPCGDYEEKRGIVTFVQVAARATGHHASVYVSEGGIGQSNIKITISVHDTAFLEYHFSVFGYLY